MLFSPSSPFRPSPVPVRRHWRLLLFPLHPQPPVLCLSPPAPVSSTRRRCGLSCLLVHVRDRLRETKMNSVVRSAVQRVLRPAARRVSGACTQRRFGSGTARRHGDELDFWDCMSLGFVLSVIWHRLQNPPQTFHERWLELNSSKKASGADMD